MIGRMATCALCALLWTTGARGQAGGGPVSNPNSQTRGTGTQRGSAPVGALRGNSRAADRGARGDQAGRGSRTGAAGPGIEQGTANGLEGGRTDVGPLGATGFASSHLTDEGQRRWANDSAQNRAGNAAGGLLRPPDFAPPAAAAKSMGHEGETSYAKPIQGTQTVQLPPEEWRGRAGGIASGLTRRRGATAEGEGGNAWVPGGVEGPTPTPGLNSMAHGAGSWNAGTTADDPGKSGSGQ